VPDESPTVTEYTTIEYERDGAAAHVRLDRPDAMNALNETLLGEFEDALDRAAADEEVRVVVVAGYGKAFSAGYDIGADEPERSVDDRIRDQRTHLEAIFSARLPVIAAVDGPALAGGCNLALACDLTFATERSEFGYPDMHFGEPPPKFVLPFVTDSLKHARELLYTGKTVDADEAHRMGLVNRVVPDGELGAAVDEEVDHIRKTPSAAVALVKDMVNDVQETQGYRRYGRLDEALGTLTMESETATRFREIRDEKGLQAALEWVHGTDKP
jgi:enoyl-CoA hydratase/carnithine racemase